MAVTVTTEAAIANTIRVFFSITAGLVTAFNLAEADVAAGAKMVGSAANFAKMDSAQAFRRAVTDGESPRNASPIRW